MNKQYKIIIIMAAMIPCLASCNKEQDSKSFKQVQVPPALMPSDPPEKPKPDPPEKPKPATVTNEDYSPGNNDWQLPTQEEQDEWDHELYVAALEKWAKPKLDNWFCQSCKEKLGKDFKFLDRDGNNIRFKCKCNCGHTHTVTLQGK
jgi:hypothetical protein